MNRRQFLCASAAAFACVGNVSAATYDLIIKGGRVIDPSVGLHAVRDVAIVAGKIAAVEADIRGDAADRQAGWPEQGVAPSSPAADTAAMASRAARR